MGKKFLKILLLLIMSSCFSAAQKQTESETGIDGLITVGPVRGGPSRIGIPDSRPLANAAFVVANEKGAVTSFTTNNQGQFRISLAPGHYTVSMEKTGKIGRYGPFDVDVIAGHMTKVEWSCDTGMR
jgi:hypothetical protein